MKLSLTRLALENLGYDVVCIGNKNLTFDYQRTKSKLKIQRQIYFLIITPQVHYIKDHLKTTETIKFDILFSINGHIICPILLGFIFNAFMEKGEQII